MHRPAARKLMIMDACVLIDFIKTDRRDHRSRNETDGHLRDTRNDKHVCAVERQH